MSRPILLAAALLMCLEARAESLRVVTTSMEPFFYEENGQPRGIEYDILQYFAKAEGRTLSVAWVDSFKDVLPALEATALRTVPTIPTTPFSRTCWRAVSRLRSRLPTVAVVR